MAEGGAESRITALLEPLRRLTKHWDVDVAALLQEYMDELAKVSGEETEPGTQLNFAEAALLVSGTANVYGRKVSDLHDLTYKVLEILTAQRRSLGPGGPARGKEDVGPFLVDDDTPFLLLDDVLPPGKDLDLPPASAESRGLAAGSQPDHRGALLLNALLRSDAGAEGGAAAFAITNAHLGAGGALYLNGLEPSFFDAPSEVAEVSRGAEAGGTVQGAAGVDLGPPGAYRAQFQGVHEDIDGIGLSQTQPADDMYYDDGPAAADDDYFEPPDELEPIPEGEEGEEEVAPASSQPEDEDLGQETDEEDIWTPLDPFEVPPAATPRPFCRGRTIVFPRSRHPKTTLPAARMRMDTTSWLCGLLGLPDPHAARARAAKIVPENLTLKKVERRMAAVPDHVKLLLVARQRELRRARMRDLHRDRGRDAESAAAEAAVAEADRGDVFGDDVFYDDGYDGGFDEVSSFAGDDANGPGVEFHGGFDDERMRPTDGSEDNLMDADLASAIVTAPETFEELVQHHLTSFIANAARYASETQLSTRVDAWHSRLRSSLDLEEARPSFDIHSYGDACVNKVRHLVDVESLPDASFIDVVAGAPRYECARMFLATLQLANMGRISIDGLGNSQGTVAALMPLAVPMNVADTPRKLLSARAKPARRTEGAAYL